MAQIAHLAPVHAHDPEDERRRRAADKMRRHRERKRRGVTLLSIEIDQDVIDWFIARGLTSCDELTASEDPKRLLSDICCDVLECMARSSINP